MACYFFTKFMKGEELLKKEYQRVTGTSRIIGSPFFYARPPPITGIFGRT